MTPTQRAPVLPALLGKLLTKMPSLDPTWPPEVRDGWMRCLETLNSLASKEPPVSPDPVACYVDAGHLREVMNGNSMMIYASPDQDEQNRLAPLYARAALPAGWKLVPEQPTQDMLYAMAEHDGWKRGDREHPMLTRWEDYWVAALAAAPDVHDAG